MYVAAAYFQDFLLEVEEAGASGDLVMSDMPQRLKKVLRDKASAGHHYDWVLILGGINDLSGKILYCPLT
jgi:lysophospholipase L1-like esterase